MPKIIITAWMGQTVRNLFFGRVLCQLQNYYSLTIVSRYGEQLQGRLLGNGKEIAFKQFNVPRWRLPGLQGKLITLLYRWNYYSLWQSHGPTSAEKYIRLWFKTNRTRYFLDYFGGRLVTYLRKRNDADRDWLRDLVYLVPIRKQFAPVDAFLLASTDILKDQMLAYSCMRIGVPVVVLVHSWDNLPARGLLSVKPTRLLVWNKFMVEEAVNLHGIPREQIDIVGVPQYETYRAVASTTTGRNFRHRLGIPEGSKILTYTCSAEWVVPDEYDLVRELVNGVKSGTFGDAFLIIRLLPGGTRNWYYLNEYGNSNLPISLDTPDPSFAAMDLGSPGSEESIRNFVELMQYSDVIINVASTITLDAILFDRPVVCPKFHSSVSTTDWNSIENVYGSSHFSRVVESDAVRLPESHEEVDEAINMCLSNPEGKSKERRELADEMMPNLPSAKLITEALWKVTSGY